MKKVLSLILAIVLLIGSVALADIDLTGMSFNELRILYEQVQQALIDTKQGGTVKVGSGTYVVGKDIPAGKWTITPEDKQFGIVYVYKNAEDCENKKNEVMCDLIVSSHSPVLSDCDATEMNVLLVDGYYVVIKDVTVYFTPFDSLSAGFFD